MSEAPHVPVEQFGRDHWSTFAYIETRVVDHGGVIVREHMRCDARRHPQYAHLREGAPPTRLKHGTERHAHDDWDCAEDLERAGLLTTRGTGMYPIFALTDEGRRVAALLRAHKAAGGSFDSFEPGPIAAPPAAA